MFGMNLGNLTVYLRADATQFYTTLSHASVQLDRFGMKAQAAGRRMMLRMTAPLALIGGAAVKSFGSFDDAMTKSVAIMDGVTPKIRKEMEETAKQISTESVTAIRDLAESYFFLASAGLTAEQSIAALSKVEKFAVAGAFDMAKATDLLTDAQSALGLTVDDSVQNMENMVRISDVLIRANTLANASAEQFSKALTNKAAAALKILNKDVEEGVAVLAAFADQGVKDVEAGEKLHIVLRDLQRAALKQPEAWRKLGLRVYDARGKMLPVADILKQLEDRFGGMSDEQKKASAQLLGFQDRSFSAIQVLIGTSAKIKEYEKQLRSAGGYTEKVANKQLTSFNSQMKILWNRIKLASIELGEALAPAVLFLSRVIAGLTDLFKGLDKTTRSWIAVGMVVSALLGPMIWLFGGLVKSISLVVKGFILLKLEGMMWAIGIGAIVVVVWALVDAFTAADLGIMKFYKSMRTVTGEKFGTFWEKTFHKISGAFWSWITDWKIAWEDIKKIASDAGHGIWNLLQKAWFNIERGFNWMTTRIGKGLLWLMERALDVMDAVDILGLNTEKIEGARGVLVAWKEGLDLSRSASEMEYKKAVGEIEKANKARERAHEKAILNIMNKEDARMKKWEKRNQEIEHKSFLEKLPPALKEKPPEYGVQAEKQAEKLRGTVDKHMKGMKSLLEDVDMNFDDLVGEVAAQQPREEQFRQMSLRRFGLEPVSSPRKEKQEVRDTEVAGKLDEMLDFMKTKNPAAVLG